MKKLSESFFNAYKSKANNDPHLKLCVSLEHIEVFLVFFQKHLKRVMLHFLKIGCLSRNDHKPCRVHVIETITNIRGGCY